MNYLKNRYPFKLLTNIFRIATRTNGEGLQCSIELKRNKSDSVLNVAAKKSSQESLDLKNKSSVSLAECQNVAKSSSSHKITPVDSYNSLPLSKTSSEHSFRGMLDRKKPSLDLKFEETVDSRKEKANLDRQLKFKLKKLQASFGSSDDYTREVPNEDRPRLKRAYPWQNFNLDSISQADLDGNRPNRSAGSARSTHNLIRSSSDNSMVTASNSSLSFKSSNHSVRSFNGGSSTSLDRKTSRGSLDEIKDQMPLFKSILKKSAHKGKPVKEVTFNNISTIYGPSTSYSVVRHDKRNVREGKSNNSSPKSACISDNESLRTVKKPSLSTGPGVADCLGRYEPLREEHSFLNLFTGKRQKIVP